MSIEIYILLELILIIKIASSQAYYQDHFIMNFIKLSGVLLATIMLICITYSVLLTSYKRKQSKIYYHVKFL